MLLKVYNKQLVENVEKTYLTAAANAGATSLTVADTDLAPAGTSSNTWVDNDYMIVGEIGQEQTEVMQMSAAVTSATSLSIDREGQSGGLRFSHPIGTPVYRIRYNRVEFSRNSTDTSSGVSVLTTIPIQPDDLFTRYVDTSNTTGYGFARFNNQTSSAFSSYSDGVNYEETGIRSSRDARTLWSMRQKVRTRLDELSDNKLKDKMIDDAINDGQRDIARMPIIWQFFENEPSLSAVANQFAYDIANGVNRVHTVKFDTQPLIPINQTRWDLLHWDRDASSADPTHFFPRGTQLLIWQRPSSAAQTTAINDAAGISATATSVTIDSSSGFNRGDYYRFIIDSEVIYATASTSTTFTGLLRGREGTTAATHADDATITERDIVYTCSLEPTDLIDTQQRTAIPEPDALIISAAIKLAPFVNKNDFVANLKVLLTEAMKELAAKYSIKQTSQFGRVKDYTELLQDYTFVQNPNLYPNTLTSS